MEMCTFSTRIIFLFLKFLLKFSATTVCKREIQSNPLIHRPLSRIGPTAIWNRKFHIYPLSSGQNEFHNNWYPKEINFLFHRVIPMVQIMIIDSSDMMITESVVITPQWLKCLRFVVNVGWDTFRSNSYSQRNPVYKVLHRIRSYRNEPIGR